ncbi:LysR family transcriptional regulator [Herbaspirillum sp. LeCh32-8]|uniref:LysR family transcriptional regulator n=1 Tax=Herbaspirillum sp. LeCh32-8 TaxID=2821356 RepID=UPI001AE1A130|nr:LysR family transcriptional regulator [Herbaspirillum sp. LeCh32-8]MBP0598171.1 LysR family transcriptional regulator [Herbaspirillum sp. LeCh32-8]
MDRLESYRLFTLIVNLGSFTKAAGILGIPRASATHVMKALEERLGTRLLERTTRNVQPTPDGRKFYERCCRILAEVEDAEAAMDSSAAALAGSLRIGLHGTHARLVILPRLAEFHARHPNIEINISAGDRLVDLVGEGIDCVVRIGVPRDSSLVARPLAVVSDIVAASPAYLERFGTPKKLEDLEHHLSVGFFSRNHDIRYPFIFADGNQTREIKVPSWIAVDSADCYKESALQGFGLIQVPRFGIADYLESGQLVQVLNNFSAPRVPVLALYPQHNQQPPRVRLFLDWLAEIYTEYFGA